MQLSALFSLRNAPNRMKESCLSICIFCIITFGIIQFVLNWLWIEREKKRKKTFNFSTDCVMHQTEYKFRASQNWKGRIYLRCWFNALAIRIWRRSCHLIFALRMCNIIKIYVCHFHCHLIHTAASKKIGSIFPWNQFDAMLFFTQAVFLSFVRFFCGLVFVAPELHRENGKFSILRWCYDLCCIAKCMNDSIVVTVIQFFFSISLRFLLQIYAKLKKTPKCVHNFPTFVHTYRKTRASWTKEDAN